MNPKDLVHSWAQQTPSATALIGPEGQLSYDSLRNLIDQISVLLLDAGLSAGDTIALQMPNSLEFVATLYAALRIGAVLCPLATNISREELRQHIDATRARVVICRTCDKRAEVDVPAIAIDLCFQHGEPRLTDVCPHRLPAKSDSATPSWPVGSAVHLSSTGTTGRPKRIIKNTDQLLETILPFSQTFGWQPSDVIVGVAPFSHQYGFISLFSAHYVGGAILVLSSFMPRQTLGAISQFRATVLLATPPMIATMGECRLKTVPDLTCLRQVIVSTAPLRASDHPAFQERFQTPIFNVYGATEATGATWCAVTPDSDPTDVGVPMHGVEIAIFDQNRETVVDGQLGPVGIRSKSSPRSYLNDETNTQRVFKSGYVFPGDTGFLDANGHLHLVGRNDLIQVGGEKVDAAEVEYVLNEHPGVRESVVHESGGGIAAVVVPASQIQSEDLLRYCASRLSPHKVPKQINFVQALERNEFGKIKRPMMSKDGTMSSKG